MIVITITIIIIHSLKSLLIEVTDSGEESKLITFVRIVEFIIIIALHLEIRLAEIQEGLKVEGFY